MNATGNHFENRKEDMKNYSDSLEREIKRLEDQGKELRKKLHAARHLFGVTAEGAGRLEIEVVQLRAAIARKDEALKLITGVELHKTFTCSSGEFDPRCSVCIAKRALESNL